MSINRLNVRAGTGHIRFWSMARTFTGLKLQGSIGKFGNEELSDVSGYADLPDGKVDPRVHIFFWLVVQSFRPVAAKTVDLSVALGMPF